jgi:hypothetical protein
VRRSFSAPGSASYGKRSSGNNRAGTRSRVHPSSRT